MKDPFYMHMGALNDDSVADIAPSFANLPRSEYKDGQYRLRRYGAFTFANGAVNKLAHQDFSQSSDINDFQGDVNRTYEDLEESCYNSAGFRELFHTFYEVAGLDFDSKVEVHQMRVMVSDSEVVETAPEGVHQDGFRRIGIFFANLENISGGEIMVHQGKTAEPILTHRFANGEYVLLNDATLWHSANPIKAVDQAQPGYFDLFVLTGDKLS